MNTRLISLLGFLVAASSFAVTSRAQNFISDGSFEQVALNTYPFYQYAAVSGSPWTFSSGAIGGSGITTTASDFTTMAAPSGSQVAFLQAVGSFIRQDFTVPSDNTYFVSFLVAGRWLNPGGNFPAFGGVLTFDVSVDSTVVGTYTTSDLMPYTQKSASIFLTAGSHQLKFLATSTTAAVADQTAFLDKVAVATVAFPNVFPPPVAAVPEPNSMLAIGAALGGLGVARQWLRRKKW
jgi:hypothetical protein